MNRFHAESARTPFGLRKPRARARSTVRNGTERNGKNVALPTIHQNLKGNDPRPVDNPHSTRRTPTMDGGKPR